MKMRLTVLPFLLFAALIGGLFACAAEEEEKSGGGVTPDPPGTVTTNVRSEGQGAFRVDFEGGAVGDAPRGVPFDLDQDSSNNFRAVSSGNTSAPAIIADVGVVSGVGDVTSIPTAGFVVSTSAIPGHGYVVKTTWGNFYRVFVTTYLIGATTGGVIGVEIKWAPLKVFDSISVTPANSSIDRSTLTCIAFAVVGGACQQWSGITFAARGTFSDGTTSNTDIANAVTWSSSSTSMIIATGCLGCGVFSTDMAGGTATVTAAAVGITTITATIVVGGVTVSDSTTLTLT